jgi:hypothetical protein
LKNTGIEKIQKYSLHLSKSSYRKKILQESESSKPGTIVFTSSQAHAAPLTGPINSTVSMRFLSLVELIQPSACVTPLLVTVQDPKMTPINGWRE